MTRIKVCVITRDEFRYAGILNSLSKNSELLVLGKTDGQDELGAVTHFKPDVIVFDLTTVPVELAPFVKTCREISPHTKLLVVGTDSDDAAVLRALRAGATGYLNIVCSPLEIADAIKAVYKGDAWIPRGIMGRFIDEVVSDLDGKVRVEKRTNLTETQRKVLELLAREGLTNKEIAAHLMIEERTVEFHISNLFRKFKLSNRNQLVIYAIKQNLVSLK